MQQNQNAFFLIFRENIYSLNDPMLTIYHCFHEISYTTFASVVDITAPRIWCAGCNLFCDRMGCLFF